MWVTLVTLTPPFSGPFGRRLRDYYVEGHRYYAVPGIDYVPSDMLHGALTVPPSQTPPRSTTPLPETVEEGDNPWNPKYAPEVEHSAEDIPPTPPVESQAVEPPSFIFNKRGEF